MSKKFIYKEGWTQKEGDKIIAKVHLPDDTKVDKGMRFLCFERTNEGYVRNLCESTINLFTEVFTQQAINRTPASYQNPLNSDGLNIDIGNFLHEAGMLLGYFVNSTSWTEQEFKDFDLYELENRLEKVMRHIKRQKYLKEQES